MTSIPRPGQPAGIVPFPRPYMVEAPPPTRPRKGMAWHKTPNRVTDPAYLALPVAARAALAMVDALCADGPIIGNKSRVCVILGIEPKHYRYGILPLIEGGFVVATEANGVMTVDLPDPVKQSLSIRQAPCKPPVSAPQAPRKRNKKSANDAALPARSLIENESNTNVLQNQTSPNGEEKEIPPPPKGGVPTGDLAAPAAASARTSDELVNQARDDLAEMLPDIAADLWSFIRQHAADEAVKDRRAFAVETVGAIRKQIKGSDAATVTHAWRQTMAKPAWLAYANKVISSLVKEALSRGTAAQAPQRAPNLARPAEYGSCRGKQPGSIYDVKL